MKMVFTSTPWKVPDDLPMSICLFLRTVDIMCGCWNIGSSCIFNSHLFLSEVDKLIAEQLLLYEKIPTLKKILQNEQKAKFKSV